MGRARAGPLSTAVLLRSIDESAGFLIENGAIERNYNRWRLDEGVDYVAAVAALKEYVEFRSNWMDGVISSF